jgi:hypothetical protein
MKSGLGEAEQFIFINKIIKSIKNIQ